MDTYKFHKIGFLFMIVFMFFLVICSTFSSFADDDTPGESTDEQTPNTEETEKTTSNDVDTETDKTSFSELGTQEQIKKISETDLTDLRNDEDALNAINSKSDLKKTYLEKAGITVADNSDLGTIDEDEEKNNGLTIDKDGNLKLGENGPTYTPKAENDGAIISGNPEDGYTISFKNQDSESQDNNPEQDLTIKLPVNTVSTGEDTTQKDLSNVEITQNDKGEIEIKSKSTDDEQNEKPLATISSNFQGEVNLNDDTITFKNNNEGKLILDKESNLNIDDKGVYTLKATEGGSVTGDINNIPKDSTLTMNQGESTFDFTWENGDKTQEFSMSNDKENYVNHKYKYDEHDKDALYLASKEEGQITFKEKDDGETIVTNGYTKLNIDGSLEIEEYESEFAEVVVSNTKNRKLTVSNALVTNGGLSQYYTRDLKDITFDIKTNENNIKTIDIDTNDQELFFDNSKTKSMFPKSSITGSMSQFFDDKNLFLNTRVHGDSNYNEFDGSGTENKNRIFSINPNNDFDICFTKNSCKDSATFNDENGIIIPEKDEQNIKINLKNNIANFNVYGEHFKGKTLETNIEGEKSRLIYSEPKDGGNELEVTFSEDKMNVKGDIKKLNPDIIHNAGDDKYHVEKQANGEIKFSKTDNQGQVETGQTNDIKTGNQINGYFKEITPSDDSKTTSSESESTDVDIDSELINTAKKYGLDIEAAKTALSDEELDYKAYFNEYDAWAIKYTRLAVTYTNLKYKKAKGQTTDVEEELLNKLPTMLEDLDKLGRSGGVFDSSNKQKMLDSSRKVSTYADLGMKNTFFLPASTFSGRTGVFNPVDYADFEDEEWFKYYYELQLDRDDLDTYTTKMNFAPYQFTAREKATNAMLLASTSRKYDSGKVVSTKIDVKKNGEIIATYNSEEEFEQNVDALIEEHGISREKLLEERRLYNQMKRSHSNFVQGSFNGKNYITTKSLYEQGVFVPCKDSTCIEEMNFAKENGLPTKENFETYERAGYSVSAENELSKSIEYENNRQEISHEEYHTKMDKMTEVYKENGNSFPKLKLIHNDEKTKMSYLSTDVLLEKNIFIKTPTANLEPTVTKFGELNKKLDLFFLKSDNEEEIIAKLQKNGFDVSKSEDIEKLKETISSNNK